MAGARANRVKSVDRSEHLKYMRLACLEGETFGVIKRSMVSRGGARYEYGAEGRAATTPLSVHDKYCLMIQRIPSGVLTTGRCSGYIVSAHNVWGFF